MIQEKNLRLAIKKMHQEKSKVVANCDHLSNLMENKGVSLRLTLSCIIN